LAKPAPPSPAARRLISAPSVPPTGAKISGRSRRASLAKPNAVAGLLNVPAARGQFLGDRQGYGLERLPVLGNSVNGLKFGVPDIEKVAIFLDIVSHHTQTPHLLEGVRVQEPRAQPLRFTS
jgi:hypothetical protein